MNLEFGLLITLIGVVSVFSTLAVVALACAALKRFFREETVRESEAPPSKELELKGVEEAGTGTFRIKLNGEEHEVKIKDLGTVGGEFEEVTPPSEVGEELKVAVGDVEYKVKVEKIGEVAVKPPSAVREYAPAAKEIVREAKEVITAPMQGTVVKVPVKVGDRIEKGTVVIVLEAMKMENIIQSAASGVVRAIKVSEGDSVNNGDILVIIG